jgi:hypothetical protein
LFSYQALLKRLRWAAQRFHTAWHEANLEFSDFWVNKYLTLWSDDCHAIQL